MEIFSKQQTLPWIRWSVAAKTAPGETESGDLFLVKPYSDRILLAVVDGVGHGLDAKLAAQKALGILALSTGHSLIDMVKECHFNLRGTRGVVMTAVSIDPHNRVAHCLGVGDVQCLFYRLEDHLIKNVGRILLRNGLVSISLPQLSTQAHALQKGDLLVFASDGIKTSMWEKSLPRGSPDKIARHIMTQYYNGVDDALVLVAEYIDQASESDPDTAD